MFVLRNFLPDDSGAVNALALAAFEQYRDACGDWPGLAHRLGSTAGLARRGEMLVAEMQGQIVGAVAYIGPGGAGDPLFQPGWSVMRMLVVAPHARGQGIGRALVKGCLVRAARDKAPVCALHTSHIMRGALRLYLQMGFRRLCALPPQFGVEYSLYAKRLEGTGEHAC